MNTASLYTVTFPEGFCPCGTKLTERAKKQVFQREQRVADIARVLVPAAKAVAAPEPVSAATKLEREYLRSVRETLSTLSVEEVEAMRDDYVVQVAEAQKHLESLHRTLALIEAFAASQEG